MLCNSTGFHVEAELSPLQCTLTDICDLWQVAVQEAQILEARHSGAAAVANSADQAERTEHQMAVMQAQIKGLQASLAQRTFEVQQHQARAEVFPCLCCKLPIGLILPDEVTYCGSSQSHPMAKVEVNWP